MAMGGAKMKDMKVVKAEKPLTAEEALYQGKADYPYGLRITLEPEVLKKIGLDKMPKVGDMMMLHAMTEVVGVNADRGQAGGKDLRVELQITMLDLKAKNQEQEYSEDDEEKTMLG